MKKLFLLFTLISISISCKDKQSEQNLLASSCESRGCSGSSFCGACKNCSGCKHCSKEGGTCGVCSSSGSSNNFVSTKKKSKKKKR